MTLVGTKDEGFLLLITLIKIDCHPLRFPFLDFDSSVEVFLLVESSLLDLTLHHGIIGSIHVIVEGCLDAFHLEWREETIVDTFLQGVDVNRFPEVAVGVHIVISFGSCCQSQLHSRAEIFHDTPPVAFIVGPTTMALIDDDKIEIIAWVFTKIWSRIPILIGTAHKGLKDGEEDTAVGGNTPLLADLIRFDTNQSIFRKG